MGIQTADAEGGRQVAECIHGLEIPLCDICYPKAVPERPRSPRAAAPARGTSARGTAGTGARAARSASSARIAVNPADQRVYHVTHLRNLERILAEGIVAPGDPDAGPPTVDVSTALTRELRQSASAAGRSVADFVPFYLAPDADLWRELRGGATDQTRWSDAARAAAPADFVLLVSTLGRLGPDTVVADGDAAATFTRFAEGEGIRRVIERLHDNEDARRAAEALAPLRVPFEAVQLIGVANDPVRDRVRELVQSVPSAPKVAVYPPWFQAG